MRDYIDADLLLNPIFVERERRDNKTSDIKEHIHNFYEIYFLIDGQINLFVENRMHHLKPFDIMIIKPNVLHRAIFCDDYRYERVVIYFDERSISDENLSKELSKQKGGVSLPSTAAKRIFNLVNILLNETEKDIYYESYVSAVLTELLVVLFRNQKKNDGNYAGVKFEKIIDYVKKNCREEIMLSNVAEKFYLSEAHLSRVFKKNTGFTFTQYINYQRVIFSQGLLTKSDKSIGEIAFESGFENLTHYGRVFKQLVGCTPSEYRKNAKQDTFQIKRKC